MFVSKVGDTVNQNGKVSVTPEIHMTQDYWATLLGYRCVSSINTPILIPCVYIYVYEKWVAEQESW